MLELINIIYVTMEWTWYLINFISSSCENDIVKNNLVQHLCQVLLLIVTALYSGLYKFMESMAKPTYSESGALIDGGMDLNSESGTAEYVIVNRTLLG